MAKAGFCNMQVLFQASSHSLYIQQHWVQNSFLVAFESMLNLPLFTIV